MRTWNTRTYTHHVCVSCTLVPGVRVARAAAAATVVAEVHQAYVGNFPVSGSWVASIWTGGPCQSKSTAVYYTNSTYYTCTGVGCCCCVRRYHRAVSYDTCHDEDVPPPPADASVLVAYFARVDEVAVKKITADEAPTLLYEPFAIFVKSATQTRQQGPRTE